MTAPTFARLRQVNVAYDPLQDRIVLRLSTTEQQEFRFWITRRYLQLLQRMLSKILEACAAARKSENPLLGSVLSDFAAAKATRDANFQTPYAEGSVFPLGEQPILLSQVTLLPATQDQQCLRLSPAQGQSIDLAINEELANVLCSLLHQSAKSASWILELDVEAEPGSIKVRPDRDLLH